MTQRKKTIEKINTALGSCGIISKVSHSQHWRARAGTERVTLGEKLFEVIMTKTFPNMVQDKNLYIQKFSELQTE